MLPKVPGPLAAKIRTAGAALEGERRQVTVLFGDIANYTALAEGLDPEEVHRIIQRCFELVTTEIHRFEGTINQYGGDGFMALFGAPLAHEDAPRRAVHAALAIQRALDAFGRELERERGLTVRMRIGINTGLVVVGRIADDLRLEYTAIGDTINLASRLQGAARPGSVVVSESTFRAIEGFFVTIELGELALKGHAPVRAFEVSGARAHRTRLQVTAERGLTPLVGRERELGVLEELFGEVKGGHGQVVFLAGEAGIGKSRLLLEFRRKLESVGERFTWLEGRCVSFGQNIPLLPVIDQLRENFGLDERDGESEVIAKVERGMRAMEGLEGEIPYVRYLLSADPGDPAVAAMDAAERRKRLFDALRALTLRGAALRSLVLVFEDIHWCDTSTREFLDFIMDSVAGAQVMMILTHRVGQSQPFAPRTFHTALNLRHLSERQAVELAARVLGSADFPAELAAALEKRAESVPLFVEEVTKSLLDLGALVRENGNLRMTRPLSELSVPDTMQDIIMARLDRLGEDGRHAVQLASVIGRQFLVRLLERVAGLTGKLDGLLRELKSLEIVYEQGLLPEPAYIFKHAVIQDVAYQSLLVQRRKELHRAVGEAIEELYRDRLSEHYAELAHHFIRGELWVKAIEYSTLAGDQAARVFANVEAKKHYSNALDAAAKRSPPMAWETRFALRSRYAETLLNLSEY
ncbi:MAG TPA: adenylate/guanylate cyclase domain-containing protein, partial [Candidatus Binataceae bacterium]|nr:adenylate/guanylate cyclase domain-containing protein [Candidatus Binataceae bacterium]